MHEQTAANNSMDYERIGRFIYSFHRVCGSVESLPALTANAPRELAERIARLAQKFDHILKNAVSTAEGELEATLQEASAVQAAIDEWRTRSSIQ